MSSHTKARLWALAGLTPVILLATWIGGPAALLVFAVLGWAWVTAVLSEHYWQTPSVRWLEKRNSQLEEQLFSTEAAMKAMARASSASAAAAAAMPPAPATTELLRRIQESRTNARTDVHAEPTDAEITRAKADMVAAFDPWEVER